MLDEAIIIKDPVEATWVGRHRVSVNLSLKKEMDEITTFTILAARSFTLEIFPNMYFLEEKEVNLGFPGIGGESLTPWFVKPGIIFAYILPPLSDDISI